ncbi:hypothetical protein A45J_2429 [hot springs metagenome]|uniref:Peptidase A2 domain-containing protein n=1 Tax=hot springs metagenome TaxID=433727 RepID=A0A5J4L347_9ZZZZ
MSIYDRDWYRESFKPKKTGFWYSPKKMFIASFVLFLFSVSIHFLLKYFFSTILVQSHISSSPISVPSKQNIPLSSSPLPVPDRFNVPSCSKVLYSSTKTQIIQYYVKGGVKYIDAEVNGISVPVMIDTGASFVSFNSDTINKLGIRSFSGQQISRTAGGIVSSYTFKCSSVKVGNFEVKDIDCSYLPSNSENLLGNSFLSRFSYSFNESDNTITLTCLDCDPDDSVYGVVELNNKNYLFYKSGRLEEIK